MDAEEGEARVGDGIDEAVDEAAPGWAQLAVGAAEGDDARVGVGAGEDGEAVGPQPGAEDGARGVRVVAGGALEADLVRRGRHGADRPVAAQLAARGGHVGGQPVADRAEVDDPRAGQVQRRDPGRVRLDRPHAVGVQAPHAGHAVGVRAPLELIERGQLAGRERDDQLADPPHLDRVRLAVGGQPRRACDAQPRLQRARRVVDPAVDDAGVVGALVRGGRRLAFDDEHALGRAPGDGPRERRRGRECRRRRRSCRGGGRPLPAKRPKVRGARLCAGARSAWSRPLLG